MGVDKFRNAHSSVLWQWKELFGNNDSPETTRRSFYAVTQALKRNIHCAYRTLSDLQFRPSFADIFEICPDLFCYRPNSSLISESLSIQKSSQSEPISGVVTYRTIYIRAKKHTSLLLLRGVKSLKKVVWPLIIFDTRIKVEQTRGSIDICWVVFLPWKVNCTVAFCLLGRPLTFPCILSFYYMGISVVYMRIKWKFVTKFDNSSDGSDFRRFNAKT